MSQAPTPQIDTPTLGWLAAVVSAISALAYLVKLGRVLQRLDQAAAEIAKLATLMEASGTDRVAIHQELGEVRGALLAIKERHDLKDRMEGRR